MSTPPPSLCVVLAVGLTPQHLTDPGVAAVTPTLRQLVANGGMRPLHGVLPAVTLSAQATLLTGEWPASHGIVGNGWHFRDTSEIRFWQQSRHLIQRPLLYEIARRNSIRRQVPFTCAKLFWWFNQGAWVDFAVTPKPWYGCDGSKVFGIHGKPDGFCASLEQELGRFPFFSFWGPQASAPATEWIAAATAITLRDHRPTLTLAYLPHLDYDLQRFGPEGSHLAKNLAVVDQAVATIWKAAHATGARLVVLSEYGLTRVTRAVALNRVLRRAGWLKVRGGPFGELLDLPESLAVAVADHQVAHVSVRDPDQVGAVADRLSQTPGVARVLVGPQLAEVGLNHPRSGEIVALADPDAWFEYAYWLDRRQAPDFAPTVDIHRKPGYDPCELFFDPRLRWPKARALWRVAQKRLGFRYRMDVVPVDQPDLVRGSHGLPTAANDPHGPVVLTGDYEMAKTLPERMVDVREWLLRAMDLAE